MRNAYNIEKDVDLSSIMAKSCLYVNQKEKKLCGKKKCNYDKDANVKEMKMIERFQVIIK